jgi:hypothetical protein
MSDPEVERLKRKYDALKSSIDSIFDLLKDMCEDLDELVRLRRKSAKQVEVAIVHRPPP